MLLVTICLILLALFFLDISDRNAVTATVSFPYQIMFLTEQAVIYKVCSACAIRVAQTLSIQYLLLLLSLSIHALGKEVL